MTNQRRTNPMQRLAPRRGIALLLCIFVVALMSLLVLTMIDSQTAQFAAVRNTTDYERALYLAGAGVHHAMAKLEEEYSWRGTVTDGTYPNDDTYSATAADGDPGEVVVTATGVAGGATRSLQVTVSQ